jgi:hypothetical protein
MFCNAQVRMLGSFAGLQNLLLVGSVGPIHERDCITDVPYMQWVVVPVL